MIGLLCFILAVLASSFKAKTRLEAENAALRHQLIILRRKMKGPAQLTTTIAGSLFRCIDEFELMKRNGLHHRASGCVFVLR